MKNVQKAPRWRVLARRGILAALLAGAAWLAWGQTAAGPQMAAPLRTPAATPVQDGRSAREAAYEADCEALRMLLADGAADESTQAQAARRLERMIGEHQAELAVEEALRGAGYASALVVLSGGAMTVLLPETTDGAEVLSLCAAQAGIPAENIRLMKWTD